MTQPTPTDSGEERKEPEDDVRMLAADCIASLAKLLTNDDGVDPEATWLELTQEQAQLIRTVASLVKDRAFLATPPQPSADEKQETPDTDAVKRLEELTGEINEVMEECAKHITLSNDFPWTEEVYCALRSLEQERDAAMEMLDVVSGGFAKALERVRIGDSAGAQRYLEIAFAQIDRQFDGKTMAALRASERAATARAEAAEKERDQARAEVEAMKRDVERIDAIKHGWRISCEEGAPGHPDRWFLWTEDWSKPFAEGPTLRAAIDAARTPKEDER